MFQFFHGFVTRCACIFKTKRKKLKKAFNYVTALVLLISPLLAYNTTENKKSKTVLGECSLVISFEKLTSELLQAISLGDMSNIAIQMTPGTRLPVALLGNISFFSIDEHPKLDVAIERDYYLRFMKKNNKTVIVYGSSDCINWKKKSTLERGKVVFGLDKNTLQILTKD